MGKKLLQKKKKLTCVVVCVTDMLNYDNRPVLNNLATISLQ